MTKDANTTDMRTLDAKEVDAVGGGLIALVVFVAAMVVVSGSGTSNDQNHRGARPNGIGWRG